MNRKIMILVAIALVTLVGFNLLAIRTMAEDGVEPFVPVCGESHTDGLVSYWKAEDDATDTLNVNNGTVSGNVTFTSGQVGKAFNIYGGGSIDVGNSSFGITDEFTIVAWVNWDNQEIDRPIFGSSSNDEERRISLRSNAATIQTDGAECCGDPQGVGDGYLEIYAETPENPNVWGLSTGLWHFVVMRWDGTDFEVWVNGDYATGGPLSGELDPVVFANYIGAQPFENWYMEGSVDEVGIYNRALSDEEINQHYVNGLYGEHYCSDFDGEQMQNPDNGHWYQMFDDTMTWHTAKEYCASLGGYLATITDQSEDDFVYNNLAYLSPNEMVWLGAADEVQEGVWEWVTSEEWEYANWAGGEPNNCSEIEHYLVYFTPNDPLGRAGFWNDLGVGNDGGCGCGGCVDEWYPMSTICEWDSLPFAVPVDIKPESCPNPLNVIDKGVLPVAILGTADFDVSEIDPAAVTLEGVAPLRWSWEDVATPYEPWTGKEGAYDCNEYGPDGYPDLTLKFDAQELIAALGEVNDGDVLVLQLAGNLRDEYGGTAFTGEDVVKIIRNIKPAQCNELVLLESFASPAGSQPHGLAFDGEHLWSVGYDTDTIYKLNLQGDILTSFASPGQGPTGLTFDGTYLWNADDGLLKIFTLDTSGNVISSFDAPGIDSTGLTFEGKYLWNADFNWNIPGGYLHRIDVSNTDDITFTSYASPGEGPEGLAFDGKYLWHVDIFDNNIYKLDTEANVLCTYQSFGINPIGLTFDGTFLWLSDFSTRTIYKIDVGEK